MPKKAYLAEHLSSEELKDRYRASQDSVETRRWHLLWKISLGWSVTYEIAEGFEPILSAWIKRLGIEELQSRDDKKNPSE